MDKKLSTASNQNLVKDGSPLKHQNLNRLISRSRQQEHQLKSAILNDDETAIERIDSDIRIVEQELINYECTNQQERKMLFSYLMDHYLGDSEVEAMLPAGVIERIKELFR